MCRISYNFPKYSCYFYCLEQSHHHYRSMRSMGSSQQKERMPVSTQRSHSHSHFILLIFHRWQKSRTQINQSCDFSLNRIYKWDYHPIHDNFKCISMFYQSVQMFPSLTSNVRSTYNTQGWHWIFIPLSTLADIRQQFFNSHSTQIISVFDFPWRTIKILSAIPKAIYFHLFTL